MAKTVCGSDGLVRILPAVQKINKLEMPQAIILAAKSVNEYPTPGAEDTAGNQKILKLRF